MLPTGDGETSSDRNVLERPMERSCELRRILRWQEPPCSSVFDYGADAADVGGYDRPAAREHLDERRSRPLVATRKRHDIEISQGCRIVVPPTGEMHAIGDAQPRRVLLQRSATFPVTNDGETRIGRTDKRRVRGLEMPAEKLNFSNTDPSFTRPSIASILEP
jgi:hypothetical protein